MQTEKLEKRDAVREYFKYVKSMWCVWPPILAGVFTWRLQDFFYISPLAIETVGWGIFVVALCWHARKDWQKAEVEKRAMQKRMDEQEAAFWNAAKK